MSYLNELRQKIKTKLTFYEISPYESKKELKKRVDSLSEDERAIFEWILLYFSDAWIAETLMLNRKRLKEAEKVLFFKLGIRSKRNMMRVYGFMSPKQNEMPDAEEIDGFIEKRTEKEIQELLN